MHTLRRGRFACAQDPDLQLTLGIGGMDSFKRWRARRHLRASYAQRPASMAVSPQPHRGSVPIGAVVLPSHPV
jgi:hypothetical protein